MEKFKVTKRACGIILKGNKILLFRRIKDGEEYFVFPGGSVEEGESVEQAAKRELKEELNIDAVIGKLLFEGYVEKNGNDRGRTSYFFLVTEFSGELKIGEPESSRICENNQYFIHWMEYDEIAKTPNLYPEFAKEKLIEYLAEQ